MKNSFIGFAFACLVGCASGSAIVIGDTRPAIEDWESVSVTNKMPEGATEIALVNASSDSGWTKQESVDYAIQELKKQAAKVGANVVVIKVARTETDIVGIPSYGGASSGGYIVPSEKEVIEGIAVYVEH
jgi:hypothetical protein